MSNYILIDNKWIKQEGMYTLPSLKKYCCVNLYDEDLNHKGWGYYKKTI